MNKSRRLALAALITVGAALVPATAARASVSNIPPTIVTPHIVCFRAGGGFCWIPWVW
jgi:hypothetical protein